METPLGSELLVADSFRVRVNTETGSAEVRGWNLHLERFIRSVRTALASLAGRAPGREPGRLSIFNPLAALESAAFGALLSPESAPSAPVAQSAFPAEAQRIRGLELDVFLANVSERIAAYGEGFPRLELWLDQEHKPSLRLSLRPLPELRDTIELRTAGAIPLAHPDTKGPNLVALEALNRELGAEALLLDAAGNALEGATTSLIWWEPNTDRGYVVAPRRSPRPSVSSAASGVPASPDGSAAPVDRVFSVTERLVARIAGQRPAGEERRVVEGEGPVDAEPRRIPFGQLRKARLTPAELSLHEVWAVNALHGIRVVTSIDGVLLPEPDERRLKWFREALDQAWRRVLQ